LNCPRCPFLVAKEALTKASLALEAQEMLASIQTLLNSKGPATPGPAKAPSTFEQIERRIFRQVGKAIGDFNLTEEGDRIMVGVSGGKDSWVMLHVLNEMRKRAPVNYNLVAVNIDQGYPGFRQDIVEDFLEAHGIEYHMENFNIAKILEEKNVGDTPCSLCSRLRRGSLYGLAEKLGCNKIALGHHREDFIETLLLNQFFIGRLGAMAPKLQAEDGKNIVIRPLVYVAEDDSAAFCKHKQFPIVICQCPLMCGETVHGDFKRRMVKDLLKIMESKFPEIKNSMISSLTNVKPSHLLDTKLWDFK
jgi:tRNA 2-thiocytidine biosynthesis protein TtcA